MKAGGCVDRFGRFDKFGRLGKFNSLGKFDSSGFPCMKRGDIKERISLQRGL